MYEYWILYYIVYCILDVNVRKDRIFINICNKDSILDVNVRKDRIFERKKNSGRRD